MTINHDSATRLTEYITELLPWAHGHQQKAIVDFVAAIIETQTANQAQLARTVGNQEAATRRLSRLIHNQRLSPHHLAEAVFRQALSHLPRQGKVRLAFDWTIEGTHHLLVVSLVTGARALPIYWRAYDQRVLKGRMRRYEMAVIKRVLTRMRKTIGRRRLIITADRGFADVDLARLFDSFGVQYFLRVKHSTKVCVNGRWQKLSRMGFEGNAHHRRLGRISYCESSPERLWVTMSRARNKEGRWEVWYLISNRPMSPSQAAQEYRRRFGCEEGFRDVKWELGFAQAKISDVRAWSRMFALFAIALLVVVTLAMTLLVSGGREALALMRRVASRRKGRWELSLVSAMVSLLKLDKSLFEHLSPRTKLSLEASLPNVS
jgi:hypothetical protein